MRRIMIVIPAFAIAFGVSTLPASAGDSPAGAASPAARQQPSDANQDPNRRICVDEQLSGSRIPRRICRTAREWAEEQEEADR